MSVPESWWEFDVRPKGRELRVGYGQNPATSICAVRPLCEQGVLAPTFPGSMVLGSTASPGAPNLVVAGGVAVAVVRQKSLS
ncbi:hypothetical protein QF037_000524 [Streptomyces canus]|nr:hypothetical protein [Streptomyces canus]